MAAGGASRIEVRTVGMLMIGTFAAYLCNGMFQDVMIIPMVHMFLFFLGGLTITVMQSGIEPSTVAASGWMDRRSLAAAPVNSPTP